MISWAQRVFSLCEGRFALIPVRSRMAGIRLSAEPHVMGLDLRFQNQWS